MNKSLMSKMFGKAKNAERHQNCNCADKLSEEVNYGLGFNDSNFSDRVLLLEIESEESVTRLEVETLNVCSLMLAAKSPFFHKLFNNNKKAEFRIRIDATDKPAFMDLLNSVYERPLTASSRDELINVMMAADKFEVPSCARQCVQLLIKSHMTVDSALFYLKFSSILLGDVALPLVDASKQHLSSHFNGLNELQQEEAMSLPLCGIEAVVMGANFHVQSEDTLLDFMLKWARKHYPVLEERRYILTEQLFGLICLQCMSALKLKEVVDCPDFNSVHVAKLAFNALLHKIELPYGQSSKLNDSLQNCAFSRPTHSHCVVFFDIRKQDCINMTANSWMYSKAFYLGGRRFYLFAQRCNFYKKEGSIESLGLFVEMRGSESYSLDFEFSARKKSSNKSEMLHSSKAVKFTKTFRRSGINDLFKMPWTKLMGDEGNDYIIGGAIRIRAQLIGYNINDEILPKKNINDETEKQASFVCAGLEAGPNEPNSPFSLEASPSSSCYPSKQNYLGLKKGFFGPQTRAKSRSLRAPRPPDRDDGESLKSGSRPFFD